MSPNKEPQIIFPSYGAHNSNDPTGQMVVRPEANSAYKDLGSVIITPAHNDVPIKVVHSWMNMMRPPNQFSAFVATSRMEVGKAYTATIEALLASPQFAKVQYIVTLEHDNIPQPDGLVRLLNQMHDHPEFAVIGGLYFTKGPGGVAQIWGDPFSTPFSFQPRPPVAGQLVECNGTGMGFTAYRASMFRDERLRKPWFATKSELTPNGAQCYTQDLWFAEDARKYGYRFAVDCSIAVGHYDTGEDITW